MHALRRYLQNGLDARGWAPAEFARRSGLTRQRVSQMLNDDRELLPQVPRRETLVAIARAFAVSESTVTAVAFEAMGYDLEAVRSEADLSTASSEQILRALADRLGIGADAEDVMGNAQHPAPTSNVTQLPTAGDVDDAEMPHDVAARRTGRKSRAQQAREQQDQDAER